MEAYSYLSQVYDTFMDDVDYAEWAAYLHRLMKHKNVKSIYEAACGTGSLTNALYRLGYDVTASDISEEMISVAAEKARRQGHDIVFAVSDIRSIEVGNKVDAVIAVCDGPNYIDFEGIKAFAASAYRALKDGGVLLFDMITKNKMKDTLDGQVFFDDSEDAACIWQNTFDDQAGTLDMDITLFVRKGALFERFIEQHTQYAHDPEAVRKTMLNAGFSNVDIFECFTDKKYDENSQRVEFLCCKE